MDLGNGVQLKWAGTYGDHSKYDLIVGSRVLLSVAVDGTDMSIRYGKPGAEIVDMVTSHNLAVRRPATMEGDTLVLGRIRTSSVAAALVIDGGLLHRLAKVYGMEVDA